MVKLRKVGAIIWKSANTDKLIKFYSKIGINLEPDTHDPGGSPHFECDIAGLHLAVFPSNSPSDANTRIGFDVSNVEQAYAELNKLGSEMIAPLQDSPWGRRFVVIDPDGRSVEVYQSDSSSP